jgi:hypothetical protein
LALPSMVITVTLHAFVDESRRKSTYLVAAVLVDPKDLPRFRKLLHGLLFPGQRESHFKKETSERRRLIVSRLSEAGIGVRASTARSCTNGDDAARQDCPTKLALDLVTVGAARLVLDTREDRDIHDVHTIRAVLGKQPKRSSMTCEHVVSSTERLPWIAAAVAWCYGAGGDWLRRAENVISGVVDLDDWVWTTRNPAADRPDVSWVHSLGLRGLSEDH